MPDVLGAFMSGIGVLSKLGSPDGDEDGQYFEDGGEFSRALGGVAAGIATEGYVPLNRMTGQGITSLPPLPEASKLVAANIADGVSEPRTVSEVIKSGGRRVGTNAPRRAVDFMPMQEISKGMVPKGNFLGIGSLESLDIDLQRSGLTAQVPDLLASRASVRLQAAQAPSSRAARLASDIMTGGEPTGRMVAPISARPLSVLEVLNELRMRRNLVTSARRAADDLARVGVDPKLGDTPGVRQTKPFDIDLSLDRVRDTSVPNNMVDRAPTPDTGGLQVNVGRPDASKGAKLVRFSGNVARIIPYVGSAFDVAEVRQEIKEGDVQGRNAAIADALINLTPLGLVNDAYVLFGTGMRSDGLVQDLIGDVDGDEGITDYRGALSVRPDIRESRKKTRDRGGGGGF